MKKFLIIFILSFTLSFLLVSIITYANQTIGSNGPLASPSGKLISLYLNNPANGINEDNQAINGTACFCAQGSNENNVQETSSGSGVVASTGQCDTGATINGNPATYPNAGTIFADQTTGYLEICNPDGAVASYPGACIDRYYSSGSVSCPNNYQLVPGFNRSLRMVGPASGGLNFRHYICCFTGKGSLALGPGVPFAKSGCFSTYASSPINPPLPAPTFCSSVDPNAYDIGCNILSPTNYFLSVRTCCFGTRADQAIALNQPSTCS